MNSLLTKLNFKSLHFDISWGCNIACPMCTFHDDKHSNKFARFEDIKSLSAGLEFFSHVHMGDGSEPLINPNWYEVIKFFKSKNKEVSIQTNGKKINSPKIAKKLVESGLDRISISIDGINDETVSRIRKGITYQEIISAIDYINQAKETLKSSTPKLESNIVAMRSNVDQLDTLVEILVNKNFSKIRIGFLELRKLNQDLIGELLIYEKQKILSKIQNIKQFLQKKRIALKLDTEIFELTEKDELRDKCLAYFERIYLRQDGNLYACYGKKYLGNVYKSSLFECINSRDYTEFVKTIEIKNNEVCSNCSFCRVMTFDNIQSHFSSEVLKLIGSSSVLKSIEYAKSGKEVRNYWNDYFENLKGENL